MLTAMWGDDRKRDRNRRVESRSSLAQPQKVYNIPNSLPSHLRETVLAHHRNDSVTLLTAELRKGWQPSHHCLE